MKYGDWYRFDLINGQKWRSAQACVLPGNHGATRKGNVENAQSLTFQFQL